MFNLSLREGTVPREWKHANVVPIFKKGSRCKAENYRPVSLTSVVCKPLESLLRDHNYDRFPRKTQFIEGYTARVSKRTVVFDKLVRIYGNNIRMGR